MERFYIYDCNGRVVGNPKGYRTMKGALREQERKDSPARRAIWAAYAARENKENNELCSIVPHEWGTST